MAKGRTRPHGDPLTRARDAGLDSLFTIHPKGFVSARNAIADALKKGGDAEAAGAVRSLSRPSISVWVVNQVARRAAKDVEALIEVSDELRQAQLSSLKGKGSGDSDLRGLTERHRGLLKTLRGVAAELLELSPTSTSSNLDRAQATLLAASAGTQTQRELLRKGELREELSPPGFDVFGLAALEGTSAPARARASRKSKKKRTGGDGRARGADDAQRAEAEAEEEAAARRREEAAAQDRRERERAAERAAAVDAAERELSASRQTLDKAEAAHQHAAERLAAAKKREAEARRAVTAAKQEVRAAERKLRAADQAK